MKSNESLKIIMEMIEGAKSAYQRTSPYFLLWGILLTISGLSEYLLVYKLNMKAGFLIWPVLGVLGGISSMYISRKEDSRTRVKTYYDMTFQYLWGGFGITLAIVIVMAVLNNINPTPFVLLLTGLPTFVSGGLIRSIHLKLGAFIFWITGSFAFYVSNEFTGPLFSLAILLGYVWPGLQLRKLEKLNN